MFNSRGVKTINLVLTVILIVSLILRCSDNFPRGKSPPLLELRFGLGLGLELELGRIVKFAHLPYGQGVKVGPGLWDRAPKDTGTLGTLQSLKSRAPGLQNSFMKSFFFRIFYLSFFFLKQISTANS